MGMPIMPNGWIHWFVVPNQQQHDQTGYRNKLIYITTVEIKETLFWINLNKALQTISEMRVEPATVDGSEDLIPN